MRLEAAESSPSTTSLLANPLDLTAPSAWATTLSSHPPSESLFTWPLEPQPALTPSRPSPRLQTPRPARSFLFSESRIACDLTEAHWAGLPLPTQGLRTQEDGSWRTGGGDGHTAGAP